MKPELVRRYIDTGQVKFVWHDFAWIGEESRLAAQAARCAGRQGKFWEYHDLLYNRQRGENQGQFSPANLQTYAAEIGLDPTAFKTCLDQRPDMARIQQELTEARANGVNATPFFFLNGQRLAGARGVDGFAQAIEAELKRLGQ